MDRIYQEFYCASSGGGCGGYILVQLNAELDGIVEVVCPKCGHEHQRNIKKGRITEQGRYNLRGKPKERLLPPITAWSKKPATISASKMHKKLKNGDYPTDEREAHVIAGKRDFLKDRWFEIHEVTPP